MAGEWCRQYIEIIDEYMPPQGQGETLASQIVTAVNKMIYKWFNDGDVYDNTHGMQGWCNDLSSEANWLRLHFGGTCAGILDRIEHDCWKDSQYESILEDLAKTMLDPELLKQYADTPASGSIYDCDGPYRFEEYEDEDEEWDE